MLKSFCLSIVVVSLFSTCLYAGRRSELNPTIRRLQDLRESEIYYSPDSGDAQSPEGIDFKAALKLLKGKRPQLKDDKAQVEKKNLKPVFKLPQDPRQLGRDLSAFLERNKLGPAFQAISDEHKNGTTIFDDEADLRTRFRIEVREGLKELSTKQNAALSLFYFGIPTRTEVIFGPAKDRKPEDQALLDSLVAAGILSLSEDKEGVTAHYSIHTHQLPNKDFVYMLTDLPRSSMIGKDSPTAQVSRTSLNLLYRIESDYEEGKRLTGIAADFGSGTGLQALAIAKLHPGVKKVIGLEVDSQSMKLAEFNAHLNGVADRFVTVDNMDAQNLKNELNGQKISYAVSNPPFNIVPKAFEKEFTVFGFGGDDGLEITQIFIDQVKEHLSADGEFLFYSQLARKKDSESFLVEDNLMTAAPKGARIEVETGFLNNFASDSKEDYALALAQFIWHQQNPKAKVDLSDEKALADYLKQLNPISEQVIDSLAKKNIDGVVPAFVRLTRKDVEKEAATIVERKTFELPHALDRAKPVKLRTGGIGFENRMLGGEQIKQLKLRPGVTLTLTQWTPGFNSVGPLLKSVWKKSCNRIPQLQKIEELFRGSPQPE